MEKKETDSREEQMPKASDVDLGVMRYVLDLSQVNKKDLPERFRGGPLVIPLREGRFKCDYDVVEAELPVDVVKKWRDFSKEPGKKMDWPLGINKSHIERMPDGAILRDA